MPRYSEERRQAVVAKLLPPHNLTAQEVAEQEGISVATIYKWRTRVRHFQLDFGLISAPVVREFSDLASHGRNCCSDTFFCRRLSIHGLSGLM
ncbi:transposase [Halomonas ramblicola]|nr:transposase [Halomonas ramblicola]MDN3520706.1 transposase [Halomonas ramblicola]